MSRKHYVYTKEDIMNVVTELSGELGKVHEVLIFYPHFQTFPDEVFDVLTIVELDGNAVAIRRGNIVDGTDWSIERYDDLEDRLVAEWEYTCLGDELLHQHKTAERRDR